MLPTGKSLTDRSVIILVGEECDMRNRILAVLFVGVLMAALDIAIVGPALPTIQQAFGVNERALAWVFTAYVLMNLVGTPLLAKLSDRFGRRSIYVLAVSLFALGSLLIVVAPVSAFWVILLGRAIQGLGAGGVFPVASAVIGDTFPPEKRGSALGLIGAVFGLAFIIGPIVGGLLLLLSWRWVFAINLPIALVVIIMAWRELPSTRRAQYLPFDWSGMATLAAALAALAFGLNQIDTSRFFSSLISPTVWPFLLAAALLLPLFWRLEHSAADPIVRPALLAPRQIKLANAITFGAGLGEVATIFMPALAVAAFGVSSSRASFMLMPLVVALAIGSPLAGRMLDVLGSRLVILFGVGLMAAGALGMSFLGSAMWGFYGASILIGLGLAALLGAPIRYITINESPEADRAAAQGVVTIFTSTGQLVGAALVGAVVASVGGGIAGYTRAFLVLGIVMLVLLALATLLKSRARERAAFADAAQDTPHQAQAATI